MWEDFVEFFGWDYFQLGVGALLGRFVRSEPQKARAVPEPAPRDMIERNFDDQLRAERRPFG